MYNLTRHHNIKGNITQNQVTPKYRWHQIYFHFCNCMSLVNSNHVHVYDQRWAKLSRDELIFGGKIQSLKTVSQSFKNEFFLILRDKAALFL